MHIHVWFSPFISFSQKVLACEFHQVTCKFFYSFFCCKSFIFTCFNLWILYVQSFSILVTILYMDRYEPSPQKKKKKIETCIERQFFELFISFYMSCVSNVTCELKYLIFFNCKLCFIFFYCKLCLYFVWFRRRW